MSTLRRPASSPVATSVAGVLSLAVAMGIGRFAFTPLLPLMIREGVLDVSSGGWIAAANYAGYLVGAMSASRMGWDARRLGVVSLASTAVLTAAMAFVLPVWLWAGLRFAAGAASAWAFVATASWCLGALAAQNRSQYAGAVYSGVGFGIALAGLFCLAATAVHQSAAALWVELGIIASVLSAPVLLLLHRSGAEPTGRSPTQAAQQTDRTAERAGVGSLVICYGVLGFGYILPATFLPVMAHALVEDPRIFGLAWPLFGLTAAASTFIAGWALQRWTRLRVWAVSNLIMGVGVLLPSVDPNPWTIGLSAMCVGGTFMIVTLAGVQEMRSRARGDVTPLVARMTAAFALGQIGGPVASSLLLHVPGFAERGLATALQVAAVVVFAAAAWLWRIDRWSGVAERASAAG